jgi:hypothetical protein
MGAYSYTPVYLSVCFNLGHYLADFDKADIRGSALETSDNALLVPVGQM